MAKKKKEVKIEVRKAKKTGFRFPSTILAPVRGFLNLRLKNLQKRKKEIKKEDPFADSGRIADNASPDADAEEQFGHAQTSAINRSIERKIVQTKKALTRIKLGNYGYCEDCGKMIDTDRLVIYPEATLCVKCEKKRE